jgi:hypothetical protein
MLRESIWDMPLKRGTPPEHVTASVAGCVHEGSAALERPSL